MEYSGDCKALSNTLILHNIFSLLNPTDLCSCRVVCRQWRESVTPHFKKLLDNCMITLESDVHVLSTLKRFKSVDVGPTKFRFSNISLTSPAMKKLLSKVASKITTLFVDYTNIISVDLFAKLLRDLVNLEVLHLDNLPQVLKNQAVLQIGKQMSIKEIVIHNEYRTPVYSQDFLESIFVACPKLEHVSLKANYDSYHQDKLLQSLFSSGRIKQLTKLQLRSISSGMFNELLHPYLRDSTAIRELKIEQLDCDDIEEMGFHNLLRTISSNLKCLDLGLSWYKDTRIDFPEMINLAVLRIYCKVFRVTSIAFLQRFQYSSQFPNLVTLELKTAPFEQIRDIFLEMQTPAVRLKNLILPLIVAPLMIANISKIFPNIKKLTLTVESAATIRQIWSSITGLEELNLCISKNNYSQAHDNHFGLDSVFSGVPEHVCHSLNRKSNAIDSVRLEDVNVHASIVNLKCLERLKIHCGSDLNSWSGHIDHQHRISDVTACLVFSRMKSLRHIDLGIGTDILTEKGSNKICSELHLVRLSQSVFTIFAKQCETVAGYGDEFEALLQMGFG